jgi:hypothetical protein
MIFGFNGADLTSTVLVYKIGDIMTTTRANYKITALELKGIMEYCDIKMRRLKLFDLLGSYRISM